MHANTHVYVYTCICIVHHILCTQLNLYILSYWGAAVSRSVFNDSTRSLTPNEHLLAVRERTKTSNYLFRGIQCVTHQTRLLCDAEDMCDMSAG